MDQVANPAGDAAALREAAKDAVGEIGRRVRTARRMAKLRAFDVATAVQKLTATVYRWENGEGDPSLHDCRIIAPLCDVSLAWLLTGEGEARAA